MHAFSFSNSRRFTPGTPCAASSLLALVTSALIGLGLVGCAEDGVLTPIEPGSGPAESTPTAPVAEPADPLEPPDCEDDNPCTLDALDPTTGRCVHTGRLGACDDGNACTTNTVCVLDDLLVAVCVGSVVECDDGVGCTLDACDPDIGCQAFPQDDACADDDPCTDDTCTPQGCQSEPSADYSPCGPYEECAVAHLCLSGDCLEVSLGEGSPCGLGGLCPDTGVCDADGVCAPEAASGEGTPPELETVATFGITGTPLLTSRLTDGRLLSASFFRSAIRVQLWRLDEEEGVVAELTSSLPGALHVVGLDQARALAFHDDQTMRLLDFTNAGPGVEPEVVTELAVEDGESWPGASDINRRLQRRADGVGLAERVMFCAFAQGDCRLTMASISPAAEGDAPELELSTLTELAVDERHQVALSGRLVLHTDRGEGAYAPSYALYRLDDGALHAVRNHSWNPSGFSNYGSVRGGVVSDELAFIALDNQVKNFVVTVEDDGSNVMSQVDLPQLSGAEPLAAVGRVVYLRHGDAVRAVDISDPAAPVVHDVVWPDTSGPISFVDDEVLMFAFERARLPALGPVLAGAAPASLPFAGPGWLHQGLTDGELLYVADNKHLQVLHADAAGGPDGAFLWPWGGTSLLPVESPGSAAVLLSGPHGPVGQLHPVAAQMGVLEPQEVVVTSTGQVHGTTGEVGGLLRSAAEGCVVAGFRDPAWNITLIDRCLGVEIELAPPDWVSSPDTVLTLGRDRLLAQRGATAMAVWDLSPLASGEVVMMASTPAPGPYSVTSENADVAGDRIVSVQPPSGPGAGATLVVHTIVEGAFQDGPPLQLSAGQVRVLEFDDDLVWLAVDDQNANELLVVDADPNEGVLELVAAAPAVTPVHDVLLIDGSIVLVEEAGVRMLSASCE